MADTPTASRGWGCDKYLSRSLLGVTVKVPVGTTELILVLRILYLYYGAYPCLTDIILVLRSLYLSYGSYTCVTELILVFWILYSYYGSYTRLTNLMLVL